MKRLRLILMSLLVLAPLAPVQAAAAFDPAFVMSDTDLTDTRVPDGYAQKFLEDHGSGIAGMKFQDLDGSMKSPGEIIMYYGKNQGVNPKFLLALIQKEQSLVDDPSPSACQIDWAAGYGRPDGSTCDDPKWQKYRGFTNQIINAAAFIRFIYDKDLGGERRQFGFFTGATASIDGTSVTPSNIATAALYTYTPHLHGNRLLATIWSRWFSPLYPDGSYLSDGRGGTYLIQSGVKRLFVNKSALRSRTDVSRVINVSDSVLEGFGDGPAIKFADYSLVKDVSTGRVYLLSGDTKRHIVSRKVFSAIGFNPEEIDDVESEDLAGYSEGEPITLKSAYPTGGLLQDKKTGGVYWVEGGVKRPIVSAEIMKTNYPNRKITPVTPATLNNYPTGEPVRFRDGELITSPGSENVIFVVSNGQRRPIASMDDFKALGYSKSRIITTNEKALAIHPLGQSVAVIHETP